MLYADSLPDNQDPDHIEPIIHPGRAVPISPNPGGADQFPLLAGVDGFNRRAEGMAASGLDLDECDVRSAPHHEVNIPMSVAKAVRDQLPPVADHPACRNALTEQSELMPSLCHGPSVAPRSHN